MANLPTGYSRFHAIVSATSRDGIGPPVISNHFFRPNAYEPWGNTHYGKKRKREPDDIGFKAVGKAVQRAHENEAKAALKHPAEYQGKQQLLNSLHEQFKKGPHVDFHGSYQMEDSGVTHKQRIQTITHEIWKTTGYRFTVKDHPRINSGHKTRFWCSQDDAHKSKLSKSARVSQDYPKPRLTSGGDMMAKPRYPCKSRLLISSRDSETTGRRIITVRMHHHIAHEPYVDSTLPPEVARAIWESFGWVSQRNSTTLPENGSVNTLPVAQASPTIAAPRSDDDENSSEEEDDPGLNVDDGVSTAAPKERSIASSSTSRIPLSLPSPLPPHSPPLNPDIFQQRMHCHITNIRDFCDGLEYQLQFKDTRMLEVVEREGASFLRLVEDCLRKEGRLVSAPVTIEPTQNVPNGLTHVNCTPTVPISASNEIIKAIPDLTNGIS